MGTRIGVTWPTSLIEFYFFIYKYEASTRCSVASKWHTRHPAQQPAKREDPVTEKKCDRIFLKPKGNYTTKPTNNTSIAESYLTWFPF